MDKFENIVNMLEIIKHDRENMRKTRHQMASMPPMMKHSLAMMLNLAKEGLDQFEEEAVKNYHEVVKTANVVWH